MEHEYTVTVQIRNGKYYCCIPELSLVAEGHSVEVAYGKLLASKEALVRQLAEAELLHLLHPPSDVGGRVMNSRSQLFRFLAKTVIIAVVVVWMAVIIVWFTGRTARLLIDYAQASANVTVKNIQELPVKALEALGRAEIQLIKKEQEAQAQSKHESPEKREARERSLLGAKYLGDRLRPYLNEFTPCARSEISKR